MSSGSTSVNLVCPVCGYGFPRLTPTLPYLWDWATCPNCGTTLVRHVPSDAPYRLPTREELARVRRTASRVYAAIVAGRQRWMLEKMDREFEAQVHLVLNRWSGQEVHAVSSDR